MANKRIDVPAPPRPDVKREGESVRAAIAIVVLCCGAFGERNKADGKWLLRGMVLDSRSLMEELEI